jgi:uncharacterized spore protein YtfJ
MENENFIERLASTFGQNASVKNVFGEAVQAGDKAIIPLAEISCGFGGGFGSPSEKNGSPAEKAGGGGGLNARPKGIYEVTPTTIRYIPATNFKQLLVSVAAGFLPSKLFFSRHKPYNNKK